MPLISSLHSPVEEAVKNIIRNTALLTVPKQYMPWLNVLKLKNDSAFPITTCITTNMRVDEESNYAEIDVLIAIYDVIPPEDGVSSEEERALWLAVNAQKYHSDLLEITDWLGNVSIGMDMFEKEQYRWVSSRNFKPLFRRALYVTKEEYQQHAINDRLYAASVTGTLRGTLKSVCCDSFLVKASNPVGLYVYPQGTESVVVGIYNDPAIKTYEFQYRIEGEETWDDMNSYTRYPQVVMATGTTVPGNNYEGRVRGLSHGGEYTDWVEMTWLQFTNIETPVVTVADPGPTTATVSWVAIDTAVDYDIRYRVEGAETWSYVYNVVANSRFLIGLTPATTYEVEVQARSAINALSEWGATTFITD